MSDIKARLRAELIVTLEEAVDHIEALEAENARLREALLAINNMGQSAVPDNYEFRSKARLIARAALHPVDRDSSHGEKDSDQGNAQE